MNKLFSNFLNSEKPKFTVIIGSGFHKEFLARLNPIDSRFNKLKDWRCLIDYLKFNTPDFCSSNNFLIDFEQIITFSENLKRNQGNEIEMELIDKLSNEFVDLSSSIGNNFDSEMLKVFNPDQISDVINLNFDTIIEEKYASSLKLKFSIKTISDYNKKGSLFKTIYSKANFRYREINGIKFWHPHGDIHHKKSLILSTRKYGYQLFNVETLRQHFKKNEKKLNYLNVKAFSWFEAILCKPILILGAGLSSNEQDILFAISAKKRNFLNYPEKDYPIFQMLKPGEVSNLGNWATPIFDNQDYQTQWKHLIKHFI